MQMKEDLFKGEAADIINHVIASEQEKIKKQQEAQKEADEKRRLKEEKEAEWRARVKRRIEERKKITQQKIDMVL